LSSKLRSPRFFLLATLSLLLLSPVLTQRLSAQGNANALPGLSLVWSKNVGGLRSLSISPDAKRLVLLTTEGKIALWTAQDAAPVWSVGKQNASNVLVGNGNGLVLTYDARSLLNNTVILRKGDTGAIVWSKNLDAAIWNAAFSNDGNFLAIGAGDNTLYLFKLSGVTSGTKVSIEGTPVSLAFSYDDKSVIVGQWDRGGISCYNLSGKLMWKDRGAANRKHVISCVGRNFVTYIGSSNIRNKMPEVYVVRAETGQLLWAYNFTSEGYNAVAMTNETASMTGVSFSKPSSIGLNSTPEHRLTCVDRSGQMLWRKGGPFWSPNLICLTPDDSGMVVYDCNRTLYRLDGQGRTDAHAFLSDQLRQWVVSADRTSIIVYTHDGQLSLLHLQ
jgi:WD40 repeat protein